MNYGFKRPKIVPEDYVLGCKKLGSRNINPTGDWRPFLPEFERQNKGIETYACVSFGTLNAIEVLLKFLYSKDENYSDKFLANASETNNGNTPKKVSDTVRRVGCVKESDYPFQYPFYETIPSGVEVLGETWLEKWDFGYEWVGSAPLKEALKKSPVGVAVYAWEQDEKGEYIKAGRANHWCLLVAYDNDRPIVFDSYEERLKVLSPNYAFEFAQIYTLKKKERKDTPSLWSIVKEAFKSFINYLKSLW